MAAISGGAPFCRRVCGAYSLESKGFLVQVQVQRAHRRSHLAKVSADAILWPRIQPAYPGVNWPASLQTLSFGRHSDQPVVNVNWPASLQKIWFGLRFNQPLERIAWPVELQKLSLGGYYLRSLGDTLPSYLEVERRESYPWQWLVKALSHIFCASISLQVFVYAAGSVL